MTRNILKVQIQTRWDLTVYRTRLDYVYFDPDMQSIHNNPMTRFISVYKGKIRLEYLKRIGYE